MNALASIFASIIALLSPHTVGAAGVYQPVQGGTGTSTVSSNYLNQCLSVTSISPLTYGWATCSGGSSTGFSTTSANYWFGQNYPFPGNATTTLLRFNGGASTTAFSANTLSVGQTGTTSIASNGTLTAPNVTIGSLTGILKATAGVIGTAVANTDYAAFSYLFPSNATTTGLGLYASTTIGAGAQATGLTIFGGATTTGTHIFQNGFISQASSTFTGNATTTGSFYAGTATSTNTYGAGLSTCNGANQALNWASGLFSCATISASGSVGNWFTPTTYAGVGVNATSTGIWFKATSPFSIIASSTFFSYASTTNFEMVLYANEFPGSDIGAKVNTAYAALPSTGGKVVIPAGSYSFSTAISCGTSGKPMLLEGTPGSTNLTYTGSATSTVFNCGGAYDSSGYLRAFGIYGINITGPSTSGASVGLEVGGTNTNQGFTAEKVVLSSFGKDLAIGNNVWIAKFSNMGLYKSTKVLSWEATSNAGEDITYEDVVFDGGIAPLTCVNSNPSVPYASAHFVNSAFDDCQVNIAAGSWNVTFTGDHWENPTNIGAGTEAPYYFISMATSTDSQVTILGGTMVNNSNASSENPNAFIYAPSNIMIDGLRVVANGGALEVGNFVIDDRQSTGNVEIKSVYNSKNNYGSGPGRAFTTIFNGNGSAALGNGLITQWSNRNGTNGFGILPLTNGNVDFINASSSALTISSGLNFGVSSTSPGTLFSVGGNAVGINMGLATSTWNTTGGINVNAGCIAVRGACLQSAAFSYLFPSNATTTLLNFNGGASTTNFSATTLAVGGTATTTINSAGLLTAPNITIGSLTGLLKATSGVISTAVANTDYAAFSYLFPNNATTTGLGLYASTTIGAGGTGTGLTIFGGATTTLTHIFQNGFISQASSTFTGNATTTGTFFAGTASSTNTYGAGLSSCNGANQAVNWSAGLFGCTTISASGSVGNWFTPTTFGTSAANSTSTLVGFTQGIYALATSTIGAGGQATGLTIWGGATTTSNAYFGSSVGIGTTSPFAKLSLQTAINAANTSVAFAIATTTGTATSSLFYLRADGVLLIGTSTQFTTGGVGVNFGYETKTGQDSYFAFKNASASKAMSMIMMANSDFAHYDIAGTTGFWKTGIFGSSAYTIWDDSGAGIPSVQIFQKAPIDSFVIGANGHIAFGTSTKGIAASSCGTTPKVNGNDTVGRITIGTGVVSACTLTFAVAYTNTPTIQITLQSAAATATVTTLTSVSNTAFTVTGNASNLGGSTIHYWVLASTTGTNLPSL